MLNDSTRSMYAGGPRVLGQVTGRQEVGIRERNPM